VDASFQDILTQNIYAMVKKWEAKGPNVLFHPEGYK
jgi:hypothetical protein